MKDLEPDQRLVR